VDGASGRNMRIWLLLAVLLGVTDFEEVDDGLDIAISTGSFKIDLEGPGIGPRVPERGPELPCFVAYESAQTGQRGISRLESEV
jgi:hypothetical protein